MVAIISAKKLIVIVDLKYAKHSVNNVNILAPVLTINVVTLPMTCL